MSAIPIITFTDFGVNGPYIGQLETAIFRIDPELRVIHLVSDAPAGDPLRSSYLLAALARQIQIPSVFLCVVDPGVGGVREALALKAGSHWYVGPDNGLLAQVFKSSAGSEAFRIERADWQLSETFHGRDLFAPVAASIASGKSVDLGVFMQDLAGMDEDVSLQEIIYVDSYGNLFTGIQASEVSQDACLQIRGQEIGYAPRFEAVQPGRLFWYRNSCGLVEVAANRGRADLLLDAAVGTPVHLVRRGN